LTITQHWAQAHPALKGILLMGLAVFSFSCMDAIAKSLTLRYDSMQVVWARYSSQTLWSFVLLSPFLNRLLRTRYLKLQILRSSLLFGATVMFFSGFRYLQMAEMTAIFEVAPLLITLFSFLLLKEQVGPERWLGVSMGLIGAVIIIRPGSDVFTPYALFPVLGACCFAGYSIATRFLGSEEPAWTSFLYTSLIGTLFASLLVPFNWTPIESGDLPLMSTFGIIGGLGHLLLIFALRYTQASVLAPFSYFGLMYNSLWGFLFFDEIPDSWTYLGALVIVGSGVFVWYRENRRSVAAAFSERS
jgi:drug/metabolite transporter (DMT)-like permease